MRNNSWWIYKFLNQVCGILWYPSHSYGDTTVGSSTPGVELSTDDWRQPAGITDEKSFLLFFCGPFLGGQKFFWLKKWRFLHKKMLLFYIWFSFALSSSSTSSAPCSSVYSRTVPSHQVFVSFHHVLPQNEVVMDTNNFFHSWLYQSVPAFVVYPPCDDPHMQRHLSLESTTSWRTMTSCQTKFFHLNPWCLICTSSPNSAETSAWCAQWRHLQVG